METEKEFLGTEPVGKLLFRLSVPTVRLLSCIDTSLFQHLSVRSVERALFRHVQGVFCLAMYNFVGSFDLFVYIKNNIFDNQFLNSGNQRCHCVIIRFAIFSWKLHFEMYTL